MNEELEKIKIELHRLFGEQDRAFRAAQPLMARCAELGHNPEVADNDEDCIRCYICGQELGPRCYKNPNGLLCDYTQLDGTVDEAHCRYCRLPKERGFLIYDSNGGIELDCRIIFDDDGNVIEDRLAWYRDQVEWQSKLWKQFCIEYEKANHLAIFDVEIKVIPEKS